MAGGNVQKINPSGTLTAMHYVASDVIHLSGILDDYALNVLIEPELSGNITVNASDLYPNKKDMTFSVAVGTKYVLSGLDGSRCRQSDGTIDITSDFGSGNCYCWYQG